MAEINTLLRSARLKQRWPVKTAASHAGVSETTYLRWEQGLQEPHLVNLQVLCDAFSLPPEKLGYGHLVEEGEIEPGEESVQRKLLSHIEELEEMLMSHRRRLQQSERALAEAKREIAGLRTQVVEIGELTERASLLEQALENSQRRTQKSTVERTVLRKELAEAKQEIYLLRQVIDKAGLNKHDFYNLWQNAARELQESGELRSEDNTTTIDFLQ